MLTIKYNEFEKYDLTIGEVKTKCPNIIKAIKGVPSKRKLLTLISHLTIKFDLLRAEEDYIATNGIIVTLNDYEELIMLVLYYKAIDTLLPTASHNTLNKNWGKVCYYYSSYRDYANKNFNYKLDTLTFIEFKEQLLSGLIVLSNKTYKALKVIQAYFLNDLSQAQIKEILDLSRVINKLNSEKELTC